MRSIVALLLALLAQHAEAFAPSSLSGRQAVRLNAPRTDIGTRSARVLVSAGVPAAADFKGKWDKIAPLYPSSTRAPRYSNRDWLDNLFNIFKSKMLRRISSHLVFNTVWAAVVLYAFQNSAAVASACSGMSTVPHSLAAGALSLLLVFRTNSAYDRFWEGRKLWGKLVNMTRELGRLGHQFLVGLDRDHYLALVAVFPSFLLQHLQGTDNTARPNGGLFSETQRAAIHGMLAEKDLELLWKTKNRPFALTKMMGAIVSKGFTDPAALKRRYGELDFSPNASPDMQIKAKAVQASLTAERSHTEKMISDYADVYGACERIIKSRVPESYSRHTSRMLSVFCLTLPLALVGSLGWRVVPAVATICWMLFTIEEVGHSIEDPFNLHILDPIWTGQEDQLRIHASLGVLRGDVMDRVPCADPKVYEDVTDDAPMTSMDYDMGKFHEDWKKSV